MKWENIHKVPNIVTDIYLLIYLFIEGEMGWDGEGQREP